MATFTSKEDEAFFAAIGRLAISWAQVEAGIDGAVAIIHQCFGGKHIETDPPRTSLYRKLRYIRKWAKTVPVPIFQESAGVLMGEIEKAAELRHDIIHGFMVQKEDGSGEAEMIRLIRGPTFDNQKRFTVTTVQIMLAAAEASKLATKSIRLATGLREGVAMLTKKPDQPLGKFTHHFPMTGASRYF
jgi:hypothetical protein